MFEIKHFKLFVVIFGEATPSNYCYMCDYNIPSGFHATKSFFFMMSTFQLATGGFQGS